MSTTGVVAVSRVLLPTVQHTWIDPAAQEVAASTENWGFLAAWLLPRW
ncbi:MAG: hypothetical protein ABJ205_08790 [Erythrobacter sp.]